MKNMQILIHVTVTEEVDVSELRQRVADQIRKLSNPVREDEGITTINHVQITE